MFLLGNVCTYRSVIWIKGKQKAVDLSTNQNLEIWIDQEHFKTK